MKSAVVIFSGGQDSTTCLYWALEKFGRVDAITFTYGQRHTVETKCAEHICGVEGVRQVIIDLPFLSKVTESALIGHGDINKIVAHGKGDQRKILPASFVPNRNQLFITLAHAYAQKIGSTDLVTGVCQTDFSGYPDCRQVFIELIQVTSNLGSNSSIQIHTPLMYLTKAQTFELAKKLGKLKEVISFSHTCYEGDRSKEYEWGYGCGSCPACRLRIRGWEEFKGQTLNNATKLQ